jgi:hypothetical protein
MAGIRLRIFATDADKDRQAHFFMISISLHGSLRSVITCILEVGQDFAPGPTVLIQYSTVIISVVWESSIIGHPCILYPLFTHSMLFTYCPEDFAAKNRTILTYHTLA